jgi:Mn-dependent DtxR family transcriptional regulator
MSYYVLNIAGKFYCNRGFISYVHYDAIKFTSYEDAIKVSRRYKHSIVECL